MNVMATIPEALAIAIGHHQAGRTQDAEQIYRQILQAEPNHPDALHLLGVIAAQVGKHEIAMESLPPLAWSENDKTTSSLFPAAAGITTPATRPAQDG
jgi:cytochrome c-type biogenesis protein CcmH/NrfG